MHTRSFIGTNDFEADWDGATEVRWLPVEERRSPRSGYPDSVTANIRRERFRARIRGTRVRAVVRIDADYDRAKAEVAAERFIHRYPRLSGFFAVNDEMALGVGDAVRATGKKGLAIIGVDGISEALDAVGDGRQRHRFAVSVRHGRMAIEACVAAARGARLPARVEHQSPS